MPRYGQSPLLGGIGGFLGGLGQGLQTLLALKQAEQERKDRERRENTAMERDEWTRFMQANNVDLPFGEYQRAGRQLPQGTSVPMLGGGMAPSGQPGPTAPAGLRDLLQQARGEQFAGLNLSKPDTLMQAAQPRTIPQYQATVQPPINTGTMAALVAAMKPQAQTPVSWQAVDRGDSVAGTARLERNPQTGETRPMRDPQGHPLLWGEQTIQRSTVPEQVIRKDAGMAFDMAQAVQNIEEVEQRNPDAVQEAAKYLTMEAGLGGIPVFGSGAQAVYKRMTGAGLSDDAQRFIHGIFQYRATAFPERGGANLTSTEIAQYSPVFDPQIAQNPAAYQQVVEARRTRVRGAAFIAGKESMNDYAVTFGRAVPEWLFPDQAGQTPVNAPSMRQVPPVPGVPSTPRRRKYVP